MTIKRAIERLMVHGAYPAVMGLSLLLFAIMLGFGWAPALAAYLPATLAAVMVTVHEIAIPERADWRPDRRTVFADLAFMGWVQMLLPKALALAAVTITHRAAEDWGLSLQVVWPVEIPLAGQVALVVLLADLPRYWLHRASHAWAPLWRLHAIHHAPDKLYWLNVGRFHPVEKALQFLLDAAPFILLGVPEAVLAGYFVFYAVNGFYQHSNARVRLGWLNFIVSGPELHRWHHSRELSEANSNFGNNLILWDLLFGTRFLPAGRAVGRVGVAGADLPGGFVASLGAPFYAAPWREGER